MQAVSTLQSIDLHTKQMAYEGSKRVPLPSPILVFLTAFILTPCVFMEALFVPLLGLILVCAVIWTGISYLRLVGSYRCYFAAAAGAASAFILISVSSNLIKTYGEFPMYIILGLGTGTNIASWLWFTGAKLLRLERGLAISEGKHFYSNTEKNS
jgi:hypothetical protein